MPPGDHAAPVTSVRLPRALLGEFLPAPQLLAGRLAASTVAIYTWDCTAYVTFCGYDSREVVRDRVVLVLRLVRNLAWLAFVAAHLAGLSQWFGAGLGASVISRATTWLSAVGRDDAMLLALGLILLWAWRLVRRDPFAGAPLSRVQRARGAVAVSLLVLSVAILPLAGVAIHVSAQAHASLQPFLTLLHDIAQRMGQWALSHLASWVMWLLDIKPEGFSVRAVLYVLSGEAEGIIYFKPLQFMVLLGVVFGAWAVFSAAGFVIGRWFHDLKWHGRYVGLHQEYLVVSGRLSSYQRAAVEALLTQILIFTHQASYHDAARAERDARRLLGLAGAVSRRI